MRRGSSSRQKWMLLVVVVVATFSPSLLAWMLNPEGNWYRPFIVWFWVIAIALAVQVKSVRHHDL